MQSIQNKIRYLFLHFLSPKEIIFTFLLLFLSFFLFLIFIYRSSTFIMTDRIMYSGNLTEGIIGNPRDTNPFKSDSQIDKDLHKLLYTSLIKNLSGDKFDLALAKEVSITSDKKNYKLVLKDNIYFSNGDPITVEDILYSLNNIPREKNYTVEKTSDKVLTFKLKKENDPDFLNNFTFPIVQKGENFESNFSTNLITSSFFKITSLEKDIDGNITSITLKRFNNGEEKLPYIKTYKLIYFKNDVEAYNAFQKKELDLLSGVPGTTISKIKDDTNIKFEVSQLPNNFSVFLNQNTNEFLRDQNLRKALSDVVDRESLTNQVLGSFGIPQKDILGNKGTPTSAEVILENLLKEKGSGFSFENGVLYMSTKKTPQSKQIANSDNQNIEKIPVKIKITTIENTELEDTAKFLSYAWKKLGIEGTVEIIDRKDLNTVVKDRDFEALLFGYSIKNESDYYSFFSSKERNYPKLNISNYTSKQVDKILDVLVDQTDKDRIKDLTSQLSNEISQDNPVIILYKPQFVFAHFLGTQIKLPNTINEESERYTFIENWYTDTEKVLNIFNNLKLIDRLDTFLY